MTAAQIAAAYSALEAHRIEISQRRIMDFFTEDSARFQRFQVQLDDLLFDYSKHMINDATLAH